MAYFPFFIELTGKRGLIVGGGPVALRKAETLLPNGPALTAVSPQFVPGFQELSGLTLLAVAASGDRALNRRVSALCRARGILVNAADDRENCTFLFPALVREGSFSAGISTGGSSPSAAVWVRERLEELLPRDLGPLLEELEGLRPRVKAAIPDQRRREAVFKALFTARLAAGRPLEERVLQALIHTV